MDELKPCLIDRNKIPFKELWKEASCFADDIVCAVGTDFMTKIAEAERKFICDLLNSLQQMEVVDAVPVVRCQDCKQGEVDDLDFPDQYYCHAGCGWNNGDFYCSYGERKEGAAIMIWNYPTLKDDGWHPSKDKTWPVGGAYHILQMKETTNNWYVYNDDDFIVAYYNNLLECWETESCLDYIQWEDVKRWCVLTDKDGNPVKDMES